MYPVISSERVDDAPKCRKNAERVAISTIPFSPHQNRGRTSSTPRMRLFFANGPLFTQWKIIPRHFLPPLIVNSALGAILFETFTVSNRRLRKRYPNAPSVLIASAAGGLAGAIHAFAGAPADNVRLVLEAGLSPSHLHGAHSGCE